MALRNIRTEGDPLLRKKSKQVRAVTDRIRVLAEDMFETMYDAQGVGLAAPQVGVLRRMVVIDVSEDGSGAMVLINPEIIETDGEQTGSEGCLSLPGLTGTVTRPNHVKVRYSDLDGNELFVEGEELLARCLCHEIDHLDGILYRDRADGPLVKLVPRTDDEEDEESGEGDESVTEEAGQAEEAEKAEEPEKAEGSEKTEEPEKAEESEKTEEPVKTEPAEETAPEETQQAEG